MQLADFSENHQQQALLPLRFALRSLEQNNINNKSSPNGALMAIYPLESTKQNTSNKSQFRDFPPPKKNGSFNSSLHSHPNFPPKNLSMGTYPRPRHLGIKGITAISTKTTKACRSSIAASGRALLRRLEGWKSWLSGWRENNPAVWMMQTKPGK